MPHRDPPGFQSVCQVIANRIERFQIYADDALKPVKEKEDEHATFVSEALGTIMAACPVSPETTYMARWLVTNYTGERDLKAMIGDLCYSLTCLISDLWNDQMLCPGITDALYVEHFQAWKGVSWVNSSGLQATRAQNDALVRAHHCSGFSESLGQLCLKCSYVRRHLQKEVSAYKRDPPGFKLLANSLPPGFRAVLDRCTLTTSSSDAHRNSSEKELTSLAVEEEEEPVPSSSPLSPI